MTLKESVRMWLNNYKAGHNGPEYAPRIEDWAELISEYLYQDDAESKKRKALEDRVELLHEDLAAEQGKRRKLEEALQASEKACDYMGSQLTEARGKIAAYEFVIRCNGVSGNEVRT